MLNHPRAAKLQWTTSVPSKTEKLQGTGSGKRKFKPMLKTYQLLWHILAEYMQLALQPSPWQTLCIYIITNQNICWFSDSLLKLCTRTCNVHITWTPDFRSLSTIVDFVWLELQPRGLTHLIHFWLSFWAFAGLKWPFTPIEIEVW